MLTTVDDDTLLAIISHLPYRAILGARLTCRRIATLSRTPALWRRILTRDGLSFAWPRPPDELHPQEVERACTRALRLSEFWASLEGSGEERQSWTKGVPCARTFSASRTDGIAVSDVHILPSLPTIPQHIRVVTASKGIWSTLVCWEILLDRAEAGAIAESRELARWTCRGGIFRGLVVNEKPAAKEMIAISVVQDEACRIEILSLQPIASSSMFELQSLHVIHTSNTPTSLSGHRLAHSDAVAETTLTDLRSGRTLAVLRSLEDQDANFGLPRLLNNAPSRVLFVRDLAIVVRARSLELFDLSTLRKPAIDGHFLNAASPDLADAGTPFVLCPDARHSFGWVDHIVLAPALCAPNPGVDSAADACYPPIHILVRAKPADLWHPDPEIIEHHVLRPTSPPSSSFYAPPTSPSPSRSLSPSPVRHQPYNFPPLRTHLLRPPFTPAKPRCRTLLLGPRGSALLVSARDTRSLVPTSLADTYSAPEPGADVLSAQTPNQHGRREALLAVGPASLCGVCERWSMDSEVGASADQRGDTVAGGYQYGDADARAPADRPTTVLLWNERGAPWSCADYDERAGVVVLGGGDGSLTVLDLVA